MNFYAGFLKQRLLSEANTDTTRHNATVKQSTGTLEDATQFYESAFKRHYSEYAINEYTRTRHLQLKAVTDGMQG
jgi:predicted enzyme related to lactoylglutathione lyase